MTILLVEDERALSDVLVKLLRQHQYVVDAEYDGASGLDSARSGIYDAIILDIMLPKKSGLEVLGALRREGLSTPVLLLTAKSEVEDRVAGLDLGADDYLAKPFATSELLARLRAITRRKGEYLGEELQFGATGLNMRTQELTCQGNAIKLSGKEYQIMEMLLQNSRQIVTRERFSEKIWGYDNNAEYNAVEVYVSFLRKKLSAIDSDVQIKAVRGIGYTLEEGA